MLIIMLGVAGSGKSTQGKLLAEHYGFIWLSMGEILRRQIIDERRELMLAGKILDDKETITALMSELIKFRPSDRLILDGFPRDVSQARWLLHQIDDGKINVDGVIHLNAHQAAVKDRLINRGRPDDNEAAIKERFKEYKETIEPILNAIKLQNVPIIEVNAEQSRELVLKDIVAGLKLKDINI